MSGRWLYEWVEVPAREIREGDLYANGATVTEVVHGPAESGDDWRDRYAVPDGDVMFRCGPSFSCCCRADSRKVVGRNARWIGDEAAS